VVLSAQASKLYSGLASAGAAVRGWATSLTIAVGAAFTKMSAVATLGGAVGGAFSLYRAISDIRDLASQGSLANSLGLSPETFTGLAGAARSVGVSVETLALSLRNLNFAGGNTSEKLAHLLATLDTLADPTERVRAVIGALGQQVGQQLAPLIANGTGELKKLAAQSQVSAAEMAKIGAADMALRQAGAAIGAVWRQVVQAIAPVVQAIAAQLVPALAKLQPLLDIASAAFGATASIAIDLFSDLMVAVQAAVKRIVSFLIT
jgi:phage-related protein